jgi:hypothetical protein
MFKKLHIIPIILIITLTGCQRIGGRELPDVLSETPAFSLPVDSETTPPTTTPTATTTIDTSTMTSATTAPTETTTVTAAETTTAETTAAQTTTQPETTTTVVTLKSGAVKDFEYTLSEIGIGKYTGNLKDGKPEGKGVLTFDGGTYDGEWKDGKPEGQGIITYTGVATYTGGFLAGQYDGEGTLELIGGNKYVGEWKNGQKNGKGKEYSNDKDDIKPGTYVIWEGTFVNGSRTGDYICTFELNDGWSVTEYVNAEEELTGTYTYHSIKKHPVHGTEEFDVVYINGQYQGRINYVSKKP